MQIVTVELIDFFISSIKFKRIFEVIENRSMFNVEIVFSKSLGKKNGRRRKA